MEALWKHKKNKRSIALLSISISLSLTLFLYISTYLYLTISIHCISLSISPSLYLYISLFPYTQNITSPCLLIRVLLIWLASEKSSTTPNRKGIWDAAMKVFISPKLPFLYRSLSIYYKLNTHYTSPPLFFSSTYCLSLPTHILSTFRTFLRWRIFLPDLLALIRSAIFDLILLLQSDLFAMILHNYI